METASCYKCRHITIDNGVLFCGRYWWVVSDPVATVYTCSNYEIEEDEKEEEA